MTDPLARCPLRGGSEVQTAEAPPRPPPPPAAHGSWVFSCLFQSGFPETRLPPAFHGKEGVARQLEAAERQRAGQRQNREGRTERVRRGTVAIGEGGWGRLDGGEVGL